MEEVDNILLINLKDLGFEFEEEPKNLGDLKAEHIYEICRKCIGIIDSTKVEKIPSTFPRGMSAKVNTTSELAEIIKSMGFRGDLNYHQLLYPNLSDSRKLLMWLVDTLPKKDLETAAGIKEIAIGDIISRKFSELLKQTWVPVFPSKEKKEECVPFVTRNLVYPSKGRKLKTIPGLETFYRDHLPLISEQVPKTSELAPSVFEQNLSAILQEKEWEDEWNRKGLESGSNPNQYKQKKKDGIARKMAEILQNTLQRVQNEKSSLTDSFAASAGAGGLVGQMGRKINYTTEEDLNVNEVVNMSEEEIQKKREAEIENLHEQLSDLQKSKEELEQQSLTMESNIRQLEAILNQEKSKTESLEKEYKIKKKTMDLLPNAEANIQKLKEIANNNKERMIQLAKEWEKHRVPLLQEYRRLKQQLLDSGDEISQLLSKMKTMREEMREFMEVVRSKEERYRELLEIYNNLPKDATRSSYTTRILEIVKNVKKQKLDIDKILLDTRSLQKEINSLSETLYRTFTDIDELVFADAKKDTGAKEAYKKIIGMNDDFKTLIARVEEIGSTSNAISTLESKIEKMRERTAQLDFDRVGKDLKEIRAENKALLAKLNQR